MFPGSGMAVRVSGSSSAGIAIASCFFPTTRGGPPFPVRPCPPLCPPKIFSHICYAKKRNSYLEPVLKQEASGGAEEGEGEVTDYADEEEDYIDELEDGEQRVLRVSAEHGFYDYFSEF